ncbi:TIGR02281 family clan AA aspartic protease [Pseudomonas sp. L-22-4S-12]|uniref:retropepsin-like aspartic protease family protein n=1 Tax=Pseudomonas sp. L-22-4S-12 TaxID=2610893 RepID=UPI0021151745|nr:TIGR02281 family clan AA aspartic protease [Pseudomonas sp. L-22-4S-12]
MSAPQAPGQRAGRVMLVLAWGAGLLLATHFFGQWEERRDNPNQQPQSVHGEGYIEVRLASGRGGHYLLTGQINGDAVTFLLDTGASAVAIPAELAARLRLEPGAPVQIRTANGTVTGQRTRLASLQLGDIRLHDVAALITPGMDGDEVLLGMSALKQLEFTQKGGTLVLRQAISVK